MNEDRTEANAREENEIADDGGFEFRRSHGCAAVFDDNGFPAEFLDKR